jgi:uncharacterized protein YdeI (YjbR/CyaY-like superfamily)
MRRCASVGLTGRRKRDDETSLIRFTPRGPRLHALIYRLGSVKRPATRERKINELVAMLARHETIHPQIASLGNPRRVPGV